MIDQIVFHLQSRLDSLKEEFHLFLGEKRGRLDPDIEKALFGEEDQLPLLVGNKNKFVPMILEHRLNHRDPFDDIQLVKDILGDIEMDPESSDNLHERDGIIFEVIALYHILCMDDKAEEASQLLYFN
jgi:hypothetical protein